MTGRTALAVVCALLLASMPSIALAAEPAQPMVKLGLTGFVDTLTCGQEITKSDGATGTLELRFQCLGGYGVVNWGFTISPQVRALIGPENEPVTEKGMIWSVNGKRRANAPHRAASTYQFHGTLKPVQAGTSVDYQDYFQFRTRDGRAGTLVFAGTLVLRP